MDRNTCVPWMQAWTMGTVDGPMQEPGRLK